MRVPADPRRSDLDEAGFTLLELLIATSLLAFISIGLYGGLHFGVRAWERNRDYVEATHNVLFVQEFLRRTLASAVPQLMASPTGRYADFRGSPARIEFIGPAPASLIEGGRARIILAVTRDPEGQKLSMAATPELAPTDAVARPHHEELFGRVEAIRFSYFGEQAGDLAPQWHDEWENEVALPALIRISIREASSGSWPDIIVATRIVADAGCEFDLLTRNCRGR
jgi:general secretion pathway protein J